MIFIKVAIIGAGLSGLSCAIELKRNGIIPVIFEQTGQIGDAPGYLISVLRLFVDSLGSPMRYLKKKYNIDITPLHALNEIVMIGPNRNITAKGNLGYIFSKGFEKNSLENQLAAVANLPVNFNNYVDINDIGNKFDHIVVATGSHVIAKELGVWKQTFHCHIRTAKIVGNFKYGIIKIWLNKNYTNSGYGYFISRNQKQAELALIVSDITSRQLDYYWEQFLYGENIKNTIIQTNDVEHHVGYAQPVKVGNIYFVGNAAGMIDSFLGFGSMRAIESGIIAARSIIKNLDYSRLLQPLQADVDALHEYRKMIDILDNNDYDNLLAFIGLPVVKQLLYNNPIYKAKYGIFFPRLITGIKS